MAQNLPIAFSELVHTQAGFYCDSAPSVRALVFFGQQTWKHYWQAAVSSITSYLLGRRRSYEREDVMIGEL